MSTIFLGATAVSSKTHFCNDSRELHSTPPIIIIKRLEEALSSRRKTKTCKTVQKTSHQLPETLITPPSPPEPRPDTPPRRTPSPIAPPCHPPTPPCQPAYDCCRGGDVSRGGFGTAPCDLTHGSAESRCCSRRGVDVVGFYERKRCCSKHWTFGRSSWYRISSCVGVARCSSVGMSRRTLKCVIEVRLSRGLV